MAGGSSGVGVGVGGEEGGCFGGHCRSVGRGGGLVMVRNRAEIRMMGPNLPYPELTCLHSSSSLTPSPDI